MSKALPGIKADGLVLWGVIEVVLAGEFELTIIVVPIKSHASFWKRHDKRIRGAVLELLHDPNFGIGNKWWAWVDLNHQPRPYQLSPGHRAT